LTKPGIYFEPAIKKKKKALKMLVAIPSPRDIQSFNDAVKNCLYDYDKLWVKHISEEQKPYTIIRNYFLEHNYYSHLAILPDDVIIHRHGIEKLVSNVMSDRSKYKVMMGIFNCDIGSPFVGCCMNLPSLSRMGREHNFLWRVQVEGKGILQVAWAGTPFAILDGRLLRDGIVSLKNDAEATGKPNMSGCCQDVVLANELAQHKIPLYIDSEALFLHLKGSPEAELLPVEKWLVDH